MDNGDGAGAASESMRYVILGEDHEATADKLEKYTGEVGWEELHAHFESGVLLYVDPTLTLAETGAAIAEDDKPRIESLLKSGDLVRPGPPHADYWSSSEARFTALVVSPFVLIQPLPNDG